MFSKLPFIQTHHAGDKYIFWLDLTSSHYANEATQWLRPHKIQFIPKEVNPLNILKVQPIEGFRSLLVNKVYEGGWETKTELQLQRRICRQIK
ncbi:unnamed protein product [Rotaria magnacalcarata]|uniref:Transposase n=2 Tax=Rotaria magnacalcarata TaxID=392030 RepID=A0A816BRA7_9BILA|nr:unnamed protein product [Rotaria magnacalcarata]CAF2003578.1 unnamed protein product [Rotaria magnacalcarata]CAF2232571.1 unnamed protein product [Rotaria magnacalcarata]CAF4018808.1 unnamed protein product [Rotaria magnacalcarata]CAF4038193.1 unnamed protein product [Rotaria magnacalcarata]